MVSAFALLAVLQSSSLGVSPYEIDYLGDGAATLSALAVVGIAEGAVKPSLDGGISCAMTLPNGRCDASSLTALDRLVVGYDSEAWARVSDIGAITAYALPFVLGAVDTVGDASNGALQGYVADMMVITETLAVATLINTTLKFAVRRPRPTQYREGAFVGSMEHRLSFPSGHTASAAAATTAYAYTFWLRHADSPWRFVVAGGAALVTGLTGYGRIGGGWHWPTDVVAGAVLGAAAGLVIPALHRRQVRVSVEPRGDNGMMLTWGTAF